MSILIEEVAHLIKTIQHRHHRRLDGTLTTLGISLVQWNALREISRHPGASMHALAEFTFNSDQAFGTLAKRLLDAGLVTRRQGEGRALVHELTVKGQNLLDQGYPRYSDVVANAFGALSDDEVLRLREMLRKLE